MILVIDNYDSFTYNLVQYLGELGEEPRVFRNDAITADEIAALTPASAGVQGPGEMTIASGVSAAISSTVMASLRYTRGSSPSSPRYWTRLYVNES